MKFKRTSCAVTACILAATLLCTPAFAVVSPWDSEHLFGDDQGKIDGLSKQNAAAQARWEASNHTDTSAHDEMLSTHSQAETIRATGDKSGNGYSGGGDGSEYHPFGGGGGGGRDRSDNGGGSSGGGGGGGDYYAPTPTLQVGHLELGDAGSNTLFANDDGSYNTKSGYGFTAKITAIGTYTTGLKVTATYDFAGAQTVTMESMGNGQFEFPSNPQSPYKYRKVYIPVNAADDTYTVTFNITCDQGLSTTKTATIHVKGPMCDDDYTGPSKFEKCIIARQAHGSRFPLLRELQSHELFLRFD